MREIFPPILAFLFSPIALLWDAYYRIRRIAYNYGLLEQGQFEVPIISVGNLTFGGTGKTPLTQWLGEYVASLGLSPMILMRGYKGELENQRGILRAGTRLGHNPFEYGDEPLLLARRLEKGSIVVGKDRVGNLRKYFHEVLPDVVFLEDGHQHLKMRRDVNIVLFDALLPLSRYKVPPLGYLREGMSALREADIIVIGRSDLVSDSKLAELKNFINGYLDNKIPIAEISYRPTGLFNADKTKGIPVEKIRGRKVICAAAIASPVSFFKLVESLGAEVIESITFPDHHYYTPAEIDTLLSKARANGAILVVTEKDIVKIKRIQEDDIINFLEIKVHFRKGEDDLKKCIHGVLQNV